MERLCFGLAAVVVVALGSIGCAPPPVVPERPASPVVPERILDATIVNSQGGESLLAIAIASIPGEHTGSGRYRTRTLDRTRVYLRRHSLEDGTLLASKELGNYTIEATLFAQHLNSWTCRAASPGRIWCLGEKHLEVLDAESLQTVAEEPQILRNTPELAGIEELTDMRVDPKTRGFVLESRDGYPWIIDPTLLVPARFDGSFGSIPECKHYGPYPMTDWHPPVLSGLWYAFSNETRKTLERTTLGRDDRTPLHPEHTYLHGRFLTRLEESLPECKYVPLLLEDPPRMLVVEDMVDHGFTLWSVLADGTTQWKVTDLPGPLVDAKLYKDSIVLMTRTMLVALRPQDGALVWTSPP